MITSCVYCLSSIAKTYSLAYCLFTNFNMRYSCDLEKNNIAYARKLDMFSRPDRPICENIIIIYTSSLNDRISTSRQTSDI